MLSVKQMHGPETKGRFTLAHIDKHQVQHDVVAALQVDETVEKIIVFGSFTQVSDPHDLDLAVFCNSSGDDYLTLSLALRKKLRDISRIIPIDLIPVSIPYDPSAAFMQEINKGEVVYEKRH